MYLARDMTLPERGGRLFPECKMETRGNTCGCTWKVAKRFLGIAKDPPRYTLSVGIRRIDRHLYPDCEGAVVGQTLFGVRKPHCLVPDGKALIRLSARDFL